MRRPPKLSAAAVAAIALAASSAKAQTLLYSFETLYDSTNNPNPTGTFPDDFRPNGGGITTSQSNIGVTNGSFSMHVAQVAGATFSGALTQIVPGIINDPNTVAISADVTIPATGQFSGAFARMGISEFGNANDPDNGMGLQAQTDPATGEVNIDLAPGTYHLTIPLIALSNPVTFDTDVPFSQIFGTGSNQLTPTSFEFYFSKANTSALSVYIDNVTAIGPSVNATWAGASGGDWTVPGNWNGGVPSLALDSATLSGSIGSNATIALNGNHSVASLTLNNSSHQYTITQGSGGTLTLDAAGSNQSSITDSAGSHTIAAPVYLNTNTLATVANAGDTLNISGNISGIASLTVAGSGTLEVSGTNSYVGGTTISQGTLLVGNANALPTSNAVVNIASGATMKFAPGIGGVTLQLPNISPGGTVDIGADHLIINYAGGPDPMATVVADLLTGRNGGTWTGTGITSSAAAANPGSFGVGFADSADAGNPAGLASGTLEVAFTLLGDADLNRIVNGIDFGIVAANFNKGVTSWDQGDFDYNDIVNGVDFGDLAANFNKGASGASAGVSAADWAALDAFAAANGLLADVPEPASMGLALASAACMLARRRRR